MKDPGVLGGESPQ